ncbi:MAG TPA: hypothetical protein VLV86_11920 [Vicinamibacterales bacterium]|nr:hypothetical protein [Vicinamibacterales bacterium]
MTGIELTLADGTKHPYTGRVYAIDRAVNPTTGTLNVQLQFPIQRSFSGRVSTAGPAR